MKKKMMFTTVLVMAMSMYSCDCNKPESLDKYDGWTVVEYSRT